MTSDVAYLFDIDGTLTPSRQAMDEKFRQKFMQFQMQNTTYLVTGSDCGKTLNQVGFQCIFLAKLTFHCCGNEVRDKGKVVFRNEWAPSTEVIEYLSKLLERSKFPPASRTSNFIEYREGSINFSIVGRNANKDERQCYIEFDKKNGDRIRIAEIMRQEFPELTVQVGGETGLDIMPLGFDKSQVLSYIHEKKLVFFGDAIFPYGNDYSIATMIEKNPHNKVFSVRGWKDVDALLFSGEND
mgnify:CR=1 FL=1